MSRIVPHLWFDKEATEAADFYTSVFENSRIKNTSVIHDTPSGSCDIVTLELLGQEFQFISAGPLFKFNPSISFLVACDSADKVDELWANLSAGGGVLMPLDKYPFSERYGWLSDKYGVNWQIMLKPESKQAITPALMFVGDLAGRCEEAVEHYLSVFPNSEVEYVDRYNQGEEPDKQGTIRHTGFLLDGFRLAAMDSAHAHKFAFNEAVSLMVYCKDQAEIDHYWDHMSADPKAEQCGWIKDKFGVSWQIVPEAMDKMMSQSEPETLARVVQAFLKMKKFDLARLEAAYQGV